MRRFSVLRKVTLHIVSGENKSREPFILITFVLAVLFGLSALRTDVSIAGFEIKNVSLLSDVSYPNRKVNFPVTEAIFTSKLKDSLRTVMRIKAAREKIAIVDFAGDSMGAMNKFFLALMQCRKTGKKVRIAYFGDSMIEGDLMTQDLRDTLQKQFGGRGVGFVPITSIVAGFRKTIIHAFSKDWSDYTLMNAADKAHPLGPSGHVYSPNGNSYVAYRAPTYSPYLNSFSTVKLYYGAGNENNKVSVVLDKNPKQFVLNGTSDVNEIVLNDSGQVNFVSLSFNCPTSQNIYGLSFEGQGGVVLDNYSFRGNSGLALTKIPSSVFRGFDNYFNYDLIVLHYGLNVVAHNIKNYSWYEIGLRNMLDYMKENFHNSSILVVAVNDKSYRGANGWETEPDVPILVEVQKKVAKEKKVAFWNLYEAMGGYNSMVHWVEGDTTLANQDYTHPNHKGAKKVSVLLYRELMISYDEYVKEHPEENENETAHAKKK